jgi:hypothetical protein
MARRNVYGNDWSSNGWPMVDEGSCTWVEIPGTNPPVNIEIQNGQPLEILRAFVADFNAEVEPVRDADTACWTAGNSVGDSNHLSGTAVDINWDSHPFEVADAGFDQAKKDKVYEILRWYEGILFWGNDWTDPKDAMHFQLSSLANGGPINTYGNPLLDDFIKRKIRADGFSTRRGGSAAPPAPPANPGEMTVPLVQRPNGAWGSPSPAWDHLIERESGGDFTVVQHGYVDVNTGGNEAEGGFQITPRTWKAHGGQEFAPSPMQATPQQQAIVAARIFLANPSGGDWGAGLPGREDASQLKAGLVPLPNQVQGEDTLSAKAEEQIDQIHGILTNPVPSQSIYADPDEPVHWQVHEYIKNDDGFLHPLYVESAARLGDLSELARVARTAAGLGKDKSPNVIARAQSVLAEIEATRPDILKAFIAQQGATK